jgi:hypothetical protein
VGGHLIAQFLHKQQAGQYNTHADRGNQIVKDSQRQYEQHDKGVNTRDFGDVLQPAVIDDRDAYRHKNASEHR